MMKKMRNNEKKSFVEGVIIGSLKKVKTKILSRAWRINQQQRFHAVENEPPPLELRVAVGTRAITQQKL